MTRIGDNGMKRTFQTLIASFAIAGLALGTTVSVLTLVGAEAAYAKAGNGGGGNGGGKNGGKGKNAGTKSASGASEAGKPKKVKTNSSVALAEPGLPSTGNLASQLKRLNAAHASLNAYANASPNSQVGKIATYRQALLDYQAAATDPELQASLDAYHDALAGLSPDGTQPEDVDAALADLQGLDSDGSFTDADLAQALRDRYPDATDEEIAAAAEGLSGVVGSDNELQDLADARDASLDAAAGGIELEPDSDAWNKFHDLLRLDEPLPTRGEDQTSSASTTADVPI